MTHNNQLDALIGTLSDTDEPLSAALIYRLSDMTADELDTLKRSWEIIPVNRRCQLLTRLIETSETSIDVDFSHVARYALNDADGEVRKLAIEALWEATDPNTMDRFIQLMQMDNAAIVREAAAQALGRFVLAGQLGDLNPQIANRAESALLEVNLEAIEPLNVIRRALESLAYSEREEVPSLIGEAYRHEADIMRVSAIHAMGCSADVRWEDTVISALDDPEPAIRYEAVRASGELLLTDSVHRLIEMLNESDREIQEAAIWSLGEIGGNTAVRALMALANEGIDDDLLDAIEDALNMAVLEVGEFVTYVLSREEDDLDDLAALGMTPNLDDEIDDADNMSDQRD